MKKIAFVIRLLQKDNFHGGGEKLFFNLIKRFIDTDYTIDIYCSKSDIEHIDGINKILVVDKHYDHLKPETMENFYAEVENAIKCENYDFVISENITPPIDITFLQGHSLLNRLKRDKNPLEAFFYNFRGVKKERMKFHKKWFAKGFRKIFVVSEVLKRDIVDNYGISEDKISVIYPGVDISPLCHCERSREPNFLTKCQKRRGTIHQKIINKWIASSQAPRNDDKVLKNITFGLAAPGFKIKGGFIFLKALGLLKKQGYDF